MIERYELDTTLVRRWLPLRPDDGHKGTFGHVFVLAGARGFSGAARLAGEAAYRSGAGLVTLGVPESIAPIVAAGRAEWMLHALPETDAGSFAAEAAIEAATAVENKDAAVIGPGITQHRESVNFVHTFLERVRIPLVIDADGLNALAGRLDLIDTHAAPLVVTPHPGEMARLLSCGTEEVQADRENCASEFAQRYGCVVVLKGRGTIIASKRAIAKNGTGNSGMATGGTGDVLAGLIAGLLAQGVPPFEAACIGAHVHGAAGDIAAARGSMRAMLAGDLLDALGEAWRVLDGDGASESLA